VITTHESADGSESRRAPPTTGSSPSQLEYGQLYIANVEPRARNRKIALRKPVLVMELAQV